LVELIIGWNGWNALTLIVT